MILNCTLIAPSVRRCKGLFIHIPAFGWCWGKKFSPLSCFLCALLEQGTSLVSFCAWVLVCITLSHMPKSPLINLLWLPHSPLPSTLHTNFPLCDQSKKKQQEKREEMQRAFLLAQLIHLMPEGKQNTVSCWSMKKPINPLISVGWPPLPIWKKGNSPSTFSKNSLGAVHPVLLSLWGMGPQGLWQKALGDSAAWPGLYCTGSLAMLRGYLLACVSGRVLLLLLSLSEGFSFLLVTQLLLNWLLSFFLLGVYWY